MEYARSINCTARSDSLDSVSRILCPQSIDTYESKVDQSKWSERA
jgi:hypothetical protein